MFEQWSISFPGCEPVAHSLRNQFSNCWVRFHSLPESKRCPEDEEEYETVLKRHNAVLGTLARKSQKVFLLTTEFSWKKNPTVPPFQIKKATHWRTDSVDESFWHVYAENVQWVTGLFDGLIRQVATEEMGNVMICATDCKWLLHPYDGGMDVILSSEKLRDDLRAEFSDWLSPHPSGL
ncbi:hypothetical protein BH10PLA1_BH10PLA1_01310 [soil metagenome]